MKILILTLITTLFVSCGESNTKGKKKNDNNNPQLEISEVLELNNKLVLEVAIGIENLRQKAQAPHQEFYKELDEIFYINCFETCEIERRL